MMIFGRTLVKFLCAAVLISAPVSSFALLQAHLDYNGCNTCHQLHGGSGGALLGGINTEATCLGCHGGLAPFPEAVIHDPDGVGAGNMGYITCRECHDAHDNQGTNIKMVGYDWDPEVDPSMSNIFADPTIRIELSSSDINNPVYREVTFATRSDFSRVAGDGSCQICHPAGPISGPTDLNNHQWGDCTVCHAHQDGFSKRQCVECHDVNASLGASAPKVVNKAGSSVGQVGSHLRGSVSDNITGLSDFDWTVQCIKCHTGHNGAVVIPNNPAVGIDYQITGGIGLGGSATTATTEAEICWGCHGPGQSEWNGPAYNGYSVSTDDWSTADFDAPNGGSATDVIPTRHALSMHTANDIDTAVVEEDVRSSSVADNVNTDGTLKSVAARTLEDVSYIRCSYCHDVHDTVVGSPTKGDTISSSNPNAPTYTYTYLRGTWLPNAYVGRAAAGTTNMPEVPPWNSGSTYYGTSTGNFTRNGSAINTDVGNNWGHYNNTTSRVNLPRLYSTSVYSTYQGAFYIDQNSGWPTSSFLGANEVQSTSGLCVLCHGADTDSMDYYTGSSLWRTGTNGHSNSTLGGSGTGADIFNGRRDLPDTTEYSMWNQVAVDFQGSGERRWGSDDGYRPPGLPVPARDVLPFGWAFENLQIDDNNDWAPPFNTGWYGGTAGIKERDSTGDYDNWFTSGNVGSQNGSSGRAHDFSCSKCHTPHASGLPALLMTNCLDIDVATWTATGRNANNNNMTVGPGAANAYARRAAGNCHRKEWWNSADNGNDPTNNTGWIKLAPGQ